MGRRLALRGQHLLLLVSGIVAAAVLAATALIVFHDYESTIAEAKRHNAVLAQVVEEHARRTFDVNRAALKEIKGLLLVGDRIVVTDEARREAAKWIDDIGTVYQFAVVDEAGRIIFTTQDVDKSGTSVADRPYFLAHAAGEDLVINGLTRSRFTGKWFFSVSLRLTDGEGRFRGILLAGTDAEYFTTLYSRLDLNTSSNMAIYKPDGTVIARRLGNWTGEVAPTGAGHPVFTTHYPRSPEGTYEAQSPIDGQVRIGAYLKVAGWPLIVTSVSERNEVLAPWRARARQIAAYCAAVLVGLTLATWWGWRRIGTNADTIRRLEETAAALEDAKAHAEAEREVAAKALVEATMASRAKTAFLTTMSHELRTPLNAIIGFSDGILQGVLGPKCNLVCNAYIADIHTAGVHLLSLINDVLDISAVEAGRLAVRREPAATRELVATVVRLVSPRAWEKQQEMDSRILEDAPETLMVDDRRMKQVLINLLGNASKFTPAQGSIRLTVAATEEGGVRFTVSDTGIGMDEAGIATALTLFGQVDNSLSRSYEGTGLGLPLAKGMVEEHGGTLAIASAIGQGTTVTVTLPPDCVVEPALTDTPR